MQYETLYHELAHSAEIIRALVRGLTQAEACFKLKPESWSILEVLGHLYDIEREDFRWRMDSIWCRPHEMWRPLDPVRWVSTRHYNERPVTETLEDFLFERAQSLAWLQSLSAPNWEAKHEDKFITIKAGELFVSWVAHDNLHIRQLVELRRERIIGLAQPFEVAYAGEW